MFILMLVTVSIIPLMMIIFGLIWRKNPPKTVSVVYGYRTKNSMRSPETWKYAHKSISSNLLSLGRFILPLSLIILTIFRDYMDRLTIIMIIIQLVILLTSFIPTERALEEKFNEKGERRKILKN